MPKLQILNINKSDITNLTTKAYLNAKSTETENKILNSSALVKKTDYITKITDIENKILDANDFDTKFKKINGTETRQKYQNKTNWSHNFHEKTNR